jgi:hypothetical protein
LGAQLGAAVGLHPGSLKTSEAEQSHRQDGHGHEDLDEGEAANATIASRWHVLMTPQGRLND